MPDTVYLDGMESYQLVKTYEDLTPANRAWFSAALGEMDRKADEELADEETAEYLLNAAVIGIADDELANAAGGLPLNDLISIFQTMCKTLDEENAATPAVDLDGGPPDL